MEFQDMFKQIDKYQEKLEQNFLPQPFLFKDKIRHLNDCLLALNQEVAELTNSFPWKPWRNIEDQIWHISNAKEEIIDCIFFLVAICRITGIEPKDLEIVFLEKLKENYNRMKRGYNKKGGKNG